MNADEIVRKLHTWKGMVQTPGVEPLMLEAADLIESLQAQLATAVKQVEKLMAESTRAGNERCDICSKATSIPCEECVPSWRSPKGARENDQRDIL